MVTTTLNGKRQVLRVDEGNSGQVECLANADAWIPTQKQANDEQDIDAFFISQQLVSVMIPFVPLKYNSIICHIIIYKV